MMAFDIALGVILAAVPVTLFALGVIAWRADKAFGGLMLTTALVCTVALIIVRAMI